MFILDNSIQSATVMPAAIVYLFVFVFGAAVGSFLNVVIHRVPNEESIVFPNSACPNAARDQAVRQYSDSQLAVPPR